jgi:hypothetical protein
MLPVVRRTTTPLIRKARRTVRSGATRPPAFCRSQYFSARLSASGPPGSAGS